MKKSSISNITKISMFAALMAVCAWICIPGPVPFTLQVLAVFLAAALIGANKAVAAVVIYILLGAAGVPVFSGGRAGVGILLGASGGFIFGFLPLAYICGKLCEKYKRSPKTLILSMLAGLLSCYIVGTLWYAFVYLGSVSLATIGTAVLQCVVPFIVPDVLKILLAAFTADRLIKRTTFFSL